MKIYIRMKPESHIGKQVIFEGIKYTIEALSEDKYILRPLFGFSREKLITEVIEKLK